MCTMQIFYDHFASGTAVKPSIIFPGIVVIYLSKTEKQPPGDGKFVSKHLFFK